MIAAFCLTISTVYADEQQMTWPTVIIDLSSTATHIYQQQAMLWLFASVIGIFLIFIVFVLLNQTTKQSANKGDVQARAVSLVWMIFLFLLVLGFAIPALRVLLVVTKG
jgi:heme/copper-type cytochrome/quinol oxidase subunit 2